MAISKRRNLGHDFEKKFLVSEWASVSFTSKNKISLRNFGLIFNHNLFFFLRCTSVFRWVKSFSFLYFRYPLKYWLEVGLYWKTPDHSLSLPKPVAEAQTMSPPQWTHQPLSDKRPFRVNFDHIFACTLWRIKTSNQIDVAADTGVLEAEN